eukprot:gene17118-biopygen1684
MAWGSVCMGKCAHDIVWERCLDPGSREVMEGSVGHPIADGVDSDEAEAEQRGRRGQSIQSIPWIQVSMCFPNPRVAIRARVVRWEPDW